nr:unnamed protein product [Digitaria exilis]
MGPQAAPQRHAYRTPPRPPPPPPRFLPSCRPLSIPSIRLLLLFCLPNRIESNLGINRHARSSSPNAASSLSQPVSPGEHGSPRAGEVVLHPSEAGGQARARLFFDLAQLSSSPESMASSAGEPSRTAAAGELELSTWLEHETEEQGRGGAQARPWIRRAQAG